MNDILEQARKKVTSLKFLGKPVGEIPNDPLSAETSNIKTEDIYLDDSLRQMFYPEDQIFFLQPSTDDRTDFEVNVSGGDLTVFKSPTLTTVSIAKKDSKSSLGKIIEDLNPNINQLKTTKGYRNETKQKINVIKNIINRIYSTNKQNIEKQLQTHEWITKFIEDQLKQDKTFYTFGEKFGNYKLEKKKNFIQM